MKKSKQLRSLIDSSRTEFIMEAHSGLSAKIVQEAGFPAIWGSGLAISASLGVRDNNEVAWSQLLDVMEFMSDSTDIPILMDGDTGYGNFNNMRRLVKKLEQRAIAGVCIEDKVFPKTNSFIGSRLQPLADVEEFCGKIKAGKDAQQDPDFCIVARVEALIAGWGMDAALARARAYTDAGADAILIHSRQPDTGEILRFMAAWDGSNPVVIVPTMYPDTPAEVFESAGISMVIWANHILRSAITAMRDTAGRIRREKSVAGIESAIAPVSEIFRLQDVDEYNRAEKRYLPRREIPRAVILAASQGTAFGAMTADKPKCLIPVRGKTILETQIDILNRCGIKDIAVVVGFKKEKVDLPGIRCIDNSAFDVGGILDSYRCALETITDTTIFSFGDILFEAPLLDDLIKQDGDIVLAVDTSWWQGKDGRKMDLVTARVPPSDAYLSSRTTPVAVIGTHLSRGAAHGEWTGLIKFSPAGARGFKSELDRFAESAPEAFATAEITEFLMMLVSKGFRVDAFFFRGHWLDIDSPEDLLLVEQIEVRHGR